MKKLLLIAICCYLTATALAQTATQILTVKGTAIDSVTSKPLSYATVVLLDAKTQQPVKGGLTKDDGSFELKTVTGKALQLTIVSVGYKTKLVNISGTDAEVNVGKVFLSAS